MAEKVTAKELDKILDLEGETVEAGGEQINVKPFRLRQLSAVLRAVEALSALGVLTRIGEDGKTVSDFSFPRMLLRGGDSVIEILSIATGKTVEWLGELDPVEGIKLCAVTWRVNADFFTRNQEAFQKALGPLGTLLAQRAASLGLGGSSASSAPATT